MAQQKSLQETFAPNSICFGCGPANAKGLRIRSFVQSPQAPVTESAGRTGASDETLAPWITAEWQPEKHHEAFPGMLNGGIVGSLLDCHCNWTAAYGLKLKNDLNEVPCTVTAEYSIKLLRPTPTAQPIRLRAHVVEFVGDDRAWVEGELLAMVPDIKGGGGLVEKVAATCRGLFVAVKEGHPAYHRWG